jgi:ZIP family zinc transporter
VNLVLLGFLGSLAAGMMTTVGALPVLFGRAPSERARDALLGFAAGVMLAASFFSLIVPSLDISTELYGDGAIPAAIAVAGILLGSIMVAMINRYMPHEHFIAGREGPDVATLRRIWLFVIAITIHNFPEGLAVGVGFGGDNLTNGVSLAIGIGLQNAPEGLAVAVALVGENYERWRAFLIAAATGLVEPIGGLLGAGAVALSEPLLPWGLAFAAGAMLYVISHEIIPETHRRGFQNEATTGLTIGLVVMLFLDVWLA